MPLFHVRTDRTCGIYLPDFARKGEIVSTYKMGCSHAFVQIIDNLNVVIEPLAGDTKR